MPSAANSSDPAEAGASPPRPSRAPLYWILGGLVAFVALSLAVAIYTDDLPPDVSDLAFTPIEVADDENLYLLLIKRGEALKTSPIIREDEPDDPPPPVPEGGAAPAEESGLFGSSAPGSKSLRDKLLVGQSWTPESLARWCPALDQLVAECRELAKYEKMQGATLRKFDDTTKFREIRGVFIQLTLAAWAQFRSGRQAEAVDTALLGLDLGRRLADDRGCMQDYFCGLAVKGFFQCALHDMAACDEISSAALGAIFDGVSRRPTAAITSRTALEKNFNA